MGTFVDVPRTHRLAFSQALSFTQQYKAIQRLEHSQAPRREHHVESRLVVREASFNIHLANGQYEK